MSKIKLNEMIKNILHKLSSHTIQNILHNKLKFKSELGIRPRFAYLLTEHTSGFGKDCGLEVKVL